MSFANDAGLGNRNHYGPRIVESRYGGNKRSPSGIVTANWTIDLAKEITGAPATTNVILAADSDAGQMEHLIPAYAKVLSCRAICHTAIATVGGTAASTANLQVGLEQADGTDIDLDGLIDATDGALTIVSNDWVEARGVFFQGGSAALVVDYGTAATPAETVSIGANAGNLYVLLTIDDITNMTAITGTLKIMVEYLPEGA